MKRCKSWLCIGLAFLSGCVTSYSLVDPGPAAVGALNVDVDGSWNRAPPGHTPFARAGTETWTQDGLLLDRLVIVPGVPDGEAILKERDESAALPPFRADMLPNELEELVESTLLKTLGEGRSAVHTENLRPHRFGEHLGVLFDFQATVSDSPQYHGVSGAFIADDTLYMLYYLAAVPHYYEKHRVSATRIIESAHL